MKNEGNATMGLMEAPPTSVITTLGLIGGEVLVYLETCGPVSASEIVKKLVWPHEMTYMAIGALVRQRLVSATASNGEIVIHPLEES